MASILELIATCTERGKLNKDAPYPPDMRELNGVDELVAQALSDGIDPDEVLNQGLMVGMGRIGEQFSRNEVFVPELLMAARAMSAGMKHLKPHFDSGAAKRKGTFVIGTVAGDLHDSGKNLVRMVMEGGGWEVVDLGVDAGVDKFLAAVELNPGCAVGLSALLTTTMGHMGDIVQAIRDKAPDTKILVGGAPLTQEFCDMIGADSYARDPQLALEYLSSSFV